MELDILPQPEMETRPDDRPEYQPPQVLTYHGDEILESLGPAQACSFNHSVVVCGTPTPQGF